MLFFITSTKQLIRKYFYKMVQNSDFCFVHACKTWQFYRIKCFFCCIFVENVITFIQRHTQSIWKQIWQCWDPCTCIWNQFLKYFLSSCPMTFYKRFLQQLCVFNQSYCISLIIGLGCYFLFLQYLALHYVHVIHFMFEEGVVFLLTN